MQKRSPSAATAPDKIRCRWCNNKNPLYVRYHDEEWGALRTDDGYLFEMLILESFQAGLSWECILNKREHFRQVYDGFDPEKISSYGAEKTEELMADPGIVRNRAKINASITNAGIFIRTQEEFGSFWNYLSSFTDGKIICEEDKVTNDLSDAISKDLKKRGMKFTGSTIIYAYLQAIGVINSHEKNCFLYPGQ